MQLYKYAILPDHQIEIAPKDSIPWLLAESSLARITNRPSDCLAIPMQCIAASSVLSSVLASGVSGSDPRRLKFEVVGSCRVTIVHTVPQFNSDDLLDWTVAKTNPNITCRDEDR